MKKLVFSLLLLANVVFAQNLTVSGTSDNTVNLTFVPNTDPALEIPSLRDANTTIYVSGNVFTGAYMIHRVSNVWKITFSNFGLAISTDIYTLTNANANNPPCKSTWTRVSNNASENLTIIGTCYSEPASSLITPDLVSISQQSTNQIQVISNPKNGSLVFDANKLSLQIYRNSNWENLSFDLPLSKTYSSFDASVVNIFSIDNPTNLNAIKGYSNTGTGILGTTNSGFAGKFQAFTTGYALSTFGKIQFNGQGAGAGKVLTSDASGNATWQSLPSTSTNIGFYAHTVSTNSIAANTTLLVPFTATRFNDGTSFSINGSGTNPNKFVASVAGMYHFDAKIIWGTAGGTSNYKHELEIRVENSTGTILFSSTHPQNFNSSELGSNQISINVALNVGDKVSVWAKHNATVALDLNTSADACFFSGYKVY